VLLTISAILFQRSATSSWIELASSDGSRYRVSPIGMVEARSTGSSTECRWWPRIGSTQLCAINDTGGTENMTWLRRAYPLTVIALWASVLALFLNALRVPRQAPTLGVVVTAALPVIGGLAIWSVWNGAARALSVLEGLSPQPVVGGLGLIGAATMLTTIAAVMIVVARR